MAGEIHDTLAQGFTSILMLLQPADAAVDDDPVKARRHLALAQRTARADLAGAVRAAARGDTVLAPSVAARLVSHARDGRPDALSGREVEVLRNVARGRTNAEIGRELYISEATVKTHLLRVFGKLGVSDRTAAVTVAIERGILPGRSLARLPSTVSRLGQRAHRDRDGGTMGARSRRSVRRAPTDQRGGPHDRAGRARGAGSDVLLAQPRHR
ncbi:MAG: LuxR C-terminal-related transcriptional regulator [Streptosporangiaceae bacterium]